MIEKKRIQESEKLKELFLAEINIMKLFSHDNIVKIIEVIAT